MKYATETALDMSTSLPNMRAAVGTSPLRVLTKDSRHWDGGPRDEAQAAARPRGGQAREGGGEVQGGDHHPRHRQGKARRGPGRGGGERQGPGRRKPPRSGREGR